MYMVLAQDVKNCGTVTDIEGNTYKTVVIGSQCWMAENLKTKHYANGTSINKGLKYSDGALAYINASYNTPYWYYPDGDVSNVLLSYGLLYNWAAVMGGASSSDRNPSGVQGICPNGWHVPSNSEWSQLLDFVSSNSQYVCESDDKRSIAKALASSQGWDNSSSSCTVGYKKGDNNKTGFGMLPAGHCEKASTYNSNNFYAFGSTAEYWLSTNHSKYENNAFIFGTYFEIGRIFTSGGSKNEGYSVRCVRNNPVDNATKMGGGQVDKQNAPVHSDNTKSNPTPNETPKQNNQKTDITYQTEDNVYKNCKSVSQCYDYLQQYPQGRYVKEVEALRDSLGSCGTIKDYDGNRYRTVQVGSQCWMAENLRNTTYADGSYISFNERGIFIGAGRGYCYVKNSSTKDKYGLQYTWAAALDIREEEIEKHYKKQRKTTNTSSNSVFPSKVQGLCPKGWHVPSIADWEQLKEQLNNGNPSQKYTERLNMNPYDGKSFWTSERETGEFFYGTGMKYFKNGSMVFDNTYFASANLFVRCVKD